MNTEKTPESYNYNIKEVEALRDKFAMAALTGLLGYNSNWRLESVATRAYKIADGMLKEREL